MTPVAIALLAFSMSSDAFAAALGKGAVLHKPGLREALRTGLIFGTVEAITPVIGWAAGWMASGYIGAFADWIAFIVLAAIGLKMIWDSVKRPKEEQKPQRHSLSVLVLTAFGTSIDAMAVGVTLALLGANIIVNALAIGAATFVMTTIGVLIGRFLGEKLGRIAEAAGGVVLLLIGGKIIVDYLMLK